MPSFAQAGNMYIDGYGTYGDFKDAGTMPGIGVGLGYTFMPNTNFYVKYLYGAASDYNATVNNTAEFWHMVWMGNIEYDLRIMMLPLYVTASAGVGYAYMKIDPLTSVDGKNGTEGAFYYGFTTGVRYHLTQHTGVFGTVGYQAVTGFPKKLINSTVAGYQLTAGVSFTIKGKNSSLTEGY